MSDKEKEALETMAEWSRKDAFMFYMLIGWVTFCFFCFLGLLAVLS